MAMNDWEQLRNIDLDVMEGMDEAKQFLACCTCAIMRLETKLNILSVQFNVAKDYNPIDTIKTRLKSPSSIFEKLERRGLPLTMEAIEENLHDVAGVRVICPFEEDVYAVADFLMKQDDIVLLERKDYIKKPKGNGYRSLHLIVEVPVYLPNEKKMVKAEVQIRTIAMELWANLEHRLRYKKGLDPDLAADLANELRYLADTTAELDFGMGGVRRKIDATRVFMENQ